MYSYKDTIVKAENISLEIDGKLILRDINFEIKDIVRPNCNTPQIISLLGNSGIGKSQLMKILAGLKPPTTGTVLLGEERKPVKVGDIGVVAQNYPLFEHRTVWSNLEMVFDKNTTAGERKEKINFYLEKFKMMEHKDKYPAMLSGGSRQRVSLIQQILCSDYFIILDEPFSGLDPIMTTEACETIKEIAATNDKNTIIIITHDIPSAISISNFLWIMGNDYDDNKIKIPGARIKFVENLMDKGLTWKENLTNTPEFFEFVRDVRNVFNHL